MKPKRRRKRNHGTNDTMSLDGIETQYEVWDRLMYFVRTSRNVTCAVEMRYLSKFVKWYDAQEAPTQGCGSVVSLSNHLTQDNCVLVSKQVQAIWATHLRIQPPYTPLGNPNIVYGRALILRNNPKVKNKSELRILNSVLQAHSKEVYR